MIIKTIKQQRREVEDLIKYCRENNLFTDNPSPFTPNRLVRRVLKKCANRKNFIVLYTLEFALELRLQGKQDVTVVTRNVCVRTKYITEELLGYKYYTLEEVKNMGKKFSAGVTNPPYKQGLFRDFMLNLLEHLIEDDGVLAQISPDDTDPNNRKNEKTLPAMKKYGLQEMEYCQDDFNVVASAPIHTYYFNKAKPYNPKVFDKQLSPTDQLTKNIVDKILAKQSLFGTLTQRTIGSPPLKGNSTLVTALSTVTKDGPVWEYIPISKARFVENGADYFFTNKFFGMNNYDHAYKGTGPLYISENVYGIGNATTYTEKEFNVVFNLPEIKFLLKYFRGSNTRCLGWSIREIPLVPAGTTNVKTLFNLTDEEKDHVLNAIK